MDDAVLIRNIVKLNDRRVIHYEHVGTFQLAGGRAGTHLSHFVQIAPLSSRRCTPEKKPTMSAGRCEMDQGKNNKLKSGLWVLYRYPR